MEFNGSLGKYKIITTDDGSQTVYSGVYDENCHSTSGAWQETIHNYVQGCNVVKKLETQDQVTIFEVGLGVAVGIYATLETIKAAHPTNYQTLLEKLVFISTEIDKDFAIWALTESDFAKAYYISLNDLQITDSEIRTSVEGVKLRVLIGDARETILTLEEGTLLDCIYQDPFSPRKNPSLWTIEWFRNLRSLSYEKTIMSTYSAAAKIRKAMALAGFFILDRQGFGRKRSCTLAICDENRSEKEIKLHNSLLNSKAIPLSDDQLTD